MPELPEVETIARRLHSVVGRKIARVRVISKLVVKEPKPSEFIRKLEGATIERIWRRAKHLIVHTDRGDLMIHLRMTGTFDVITGDDPKFVRVAFDLDDGSKLVFHDRRHLGEARLVDDAKEELKELGPEPWDEFDLKILTSSNRPIKAHLMDQSVIAGIGNIYADESLYRAKIHPLRKASSLDDKEAKNLLKCIRAALQDSIDDMKDEVPISWRYLDEGPSPFLVYDRAGEKCKRCKSTLTALRVAGRTTVICPKCQPAPSRARAKKRKASR